jgi:3-phosphoshikimate 1-carboxyvinyltransferase
MTIVRHVRTLTAPLAATVAVPGSKSIANRALVCAALANGTSVLSNVPDGDDTVAMLGCLAGLGIGATCDEDRVTIGASGALFHSAADMVHAGLAGTTSRFVTALAALGSMPIRIDGDPPLRRRPFGPLHDALQQLGVVVTPGELPGQLPVTVQGPPTSGTVRIRGDVSSQFVTALMLIGPYLADGLRIELTSRLVSRPYVDMTAAVMGWFGHDDISIDDGVIDAGLTDDGVIVVGPGRYRPSEIAIEPDASSASYPLALAAVAGGSVHVPGLGLDALQGDARFADLLAEMGCSVVRTPDGVWVGRDLDQDIEGLDVDMADISDLVPTMAVVAAFAASPTVIRGVGFIRDKESDRLGDLAAELRRAGVDIDETDDGLIVRPSLTSLHAAQLATHHDHRLAMAFGVLGSAVDGIVVEDPDVVTKSWPGFWSMLEAVGDG